MASEDNVSIVGLPLPASSAERVALAIPLARASSDRLRLCVAAQAAQVGRHHRHEIVYHAERAYQ